MIGRFLQGMPTRPVLYLAPAGAVIVLILYYGGRYQDCRTQAFLRAELLRQASDSLGGTFDLAQFTPFSWSRAFFVTRYREVRGVAGCPFGWNWPDREYRNELLAQRKLGALVFTKEKKVAGYVEMNLKKITPLLESDQFLTPEQAVFRVERTSADGGASAAGLLLIPIGREHARARLPASRPCLSAVFSKAAAAS